MDADLKTGQRTDSFSRKRLIVAIFFSLFAAGYLIVSVLAPVSKTESVNAEYMYKGPEKNGLNDTLLKDSSFIALYRQKAFLQARITMAATDSAVLSIDMTDSIARIEIKGVTVHSSGIKNIRLSSVFTKCDPYAITSLLSKPFVISKSFASIPKEPVVHKVAPRDTSEYKPYEIPDTSRKVYVNIILETENGFRLYMYQETNGSMPARLHRFTFDLTDRLRNAAYIIKCMGTLSKPEYKPYIKVTLPAKEVMAIYRAIPAKGQFAVRI